MGFTDILNRLSNLVEGQKTSDSPWVSRSEFFNLASDMVNMLSEGVQIIGDVIIEGKPYPASELVDTEVLATTVSLEWTVAIGNDVVQWLERSANAGVDWTILDDDVSGHTYTDTTALAETDYLYRIGAYVPIGKPIQKKIVWRHNEYLGEAYPENVTLGLTNIIMIPCTQDGKIIDVGLQLENTGSDSVDDLSLDVDIKINHKKSNDPVNITGIEIVYVSEDSTNGGGTLSFTYVGPSNGLLEWQDAGDGSSGGTVDLTINGPRFRVYSSTSTRYIDVVVTSYSSLPGSNKTDTITIADSVSIFDTKPKITKAADSPANTWQDATGITQPTITDGEGYFKEGNLILLSLGLTRTTPDSEMTGAMVILTTEEGEKEYADEYSNVLSVTTPAA